MQAKTVCLPHFWADIAYHLCGIGHSRGKFEYRSCAKKKMFTEVTTGLNRFNFDLECNKEDEPQIEQMKNYLMNTKNQCSYSRRRSIIRIANIKKRDSSVPRISQMPQLKGISGACAILTQHFYSWKYMFERTGITIHIVYVNVNAHTNTINRSSPTYILINYIQIQTLQYNVVQQIYFICIVN